MLTITRRFILALILVLPCAAATHYVSAAGADTNNGTTKTTSWLHAPGMTGCSNNCASYTPAAGDQIILRGGDTWHFGTATSPSTAGGWTFTWSGSSGNPIYIGVDLTYFAGGSWVRPILNGDNPLNTMPGVVNSQVASCAHPGSLDFEVDGNWVTVDNFEFTGFCWNTNSFGNNIMMKFTPTATPNGDIVERCYVHGWTNTAAGQAEGGTFLESYNMFGGTTLTLSVIDGSDSDPATLNYDSGNLDFMTYNVIRYNQGQNSTSGCYRVHDNLFEHMDNVADGSGAHSDVLQCYGETANGSGDPNLFYNNVFQFIPDSGDPLSTNAIWFFPPVGQTDYAFNNVSNCAGSPTGPDNWMFNQTGGPGGGNLALINNTLAMCSAGGILRNDLGGGGSVSSTNNHFIATPATAATVFAIPGTVTETSDLFMTDSTATSQGYTTGNGYAPTSGTNSTIGAGVNETSVCNGFGDALAIASCKSGTTAGCTYVTATHSVSCPFLTANARPSSGAWNAGAYQFVGSGTVATPTFSPIAGTYVGTQSVTISTATGGATLCYTTDGTTPLAATPGTCSHGTTYSGAVSVSASLTLKAIGTESGFTNSAVGTAAYVIQGITITSPTNLQIVQTRQALPFTVSLMGLPNADHVIWTVDYTQRWATGYAKPNSATYTDPSDTWTGNPFQVTWFPWRNGDGTHIVKACVYDSQISVANPYGNLLVPCVTQSFIARLQGMSNHTVTGFPTSGTGTATSTVNGNAYGAASLMDGYWMGTGNSYSDPLFSDCGGGGLTVVTTCWFNGPHLFIRAGYPPNGNGQSFYDPVIVQSAFTSSAVSGNQINISAHQFQNGNAAVLLTTGTLPPPLTAGKQFLWTTSPTNGSNTATLSFSTSGNGTVNCSSACGLTTGMPIYILNYQYTNQITGVNGCDGYTTATTSTGGTATSFTYTMPSTCPVGTVTVGANTNPVQITLSGNLPGTGDSITFSGLTGSCVGSSPSVGWTCLNGTHTLTLVSGSTYSIGGISTVGSGAMTGTPVYVVPSVATPLALEVDVNPVFLQYVDPDHVTLSATPGGSTITLTGAGGSGNTLQTRLRSPVWTQAGANGIMNGDWIGTGGVYNTYVPVTLANPTCPGSCTPSQLAPPSKEYHGYFGKTGDTVCPVIWNVDFPTTQTPTVISCGSPVTYSITPDGGITGAISVNSTTGAITYANTSSWVYASGIIPPANPVAWAYIDVACPTCSSTGGPLPIVRTFIENHGNSSTTVTYPHHTTCGVAAQGFNLSLPAGCNSFWPISVESVNPVSAPAWLGPALSRANFNSIMDENAAFDNLIDPTKTTCPTWPSSTQTTIANFLNNNNLYAEWDWWFTWFTLGSDTTSLATILNNLGYDRKTCLQTLVQYITKTGAYSSTGLGRVWRFYNDDEVTFYLQGAQTINTLMPNLNIGGPNWPPTGTAAITTAGGVATFNLSGIATGCPVNFPSGPGCTAVWNQSTGAGVPLEVIGLTMNSGCNGWYLFTAVSLTTWTAPAPSGCANGLTITASTDPGGQIVQPPSYGESNPIFQSGAVGSVNTSSLPWNEGHYYQQFSSTTYLTLSGSTATVHTPGIGVMAPNHGCTGCNAALRIWGGTTANLNILAGTTWVDADDVSFVYAGTTGAAVPTCTGTSSQCNGTTDPNAYITVDPAWGANALQQFYTLVNAAVTNGPITEFSILGAFFNGSPLPSMYSFEGNPNNVGGSWLYIPQAPGAFLGPDLTVNEWMTTSDSTSGLATRAFQLRPRTMLWTEGYMSGGNTLQLCRSFTFNPACDKVGFSQLNDRHEGAVAQIGGQAMNGVVGGRMYGMYQDTNSGYSKLGLGWKSTAVTIGTGGSMNPFTQPGTWSAVAHTNALLQMTADTRLQPETDKPYLPQPYFKTDAHLSPQYGNQTAVLCGSEMPMGTLPVPLNPISGGSTLLYTTDGWTTTVTAVAGNPSSITKEWCPTPGFLSVYVSQPPGYTALDQISFAPPAVFPPVLIPNAVKFVVQVGYYADDLRNDPITDCTATCTIGVDHHNINAWYRVIYLDSNNLPIVYGQPTLIPSLGLP